MNFTCSKCGSTKVNSQPYARTKLENLLNKLGMAKLIRGKFPGGQYVVTCKECGYEGVMCVQ